MKRDEDDKAQRPPVNPASSPFGHLFLTPGGPRQSAEWVKRESDRRAGRNRKDWWKNPPRAK